MPTRLPSVTIPALMLEDSNMTMTEYLRSFKWQKQAHSDAATWHHDTLEKKGPDAREAFEAGHNKGWHDCLSALKTHGFITVSK